MNVTFRFSCRMLEVQILFEKRAESEISERLASNALLVENYMHCFQNSTRGASGERETPVPIPNTAVKPLIADGS